MFEAYSERARRIVFLARYEAGRLAFDNIEAEHFVLGFVLEDQGDSHAHFFKAITPGIPDQGSWTRKTAEPAYGFLSPVTASHLRAALSVKGTRLEPQSTYGDMPLSDKARAALKAAYAHADGKTVIPLHLLWGVLADDGNQSTKLLIEHGVTKERVDEAIRGL